jgi:hypothetical protein
MQIFVISIFALPEMERPIINCMKKVRIIRNNRNNPIIDEFYDAENYEEFKIAKRNVL